MKPIKLTAEDWKPYITGAYRFGADALGLRNALGNPCSGLDGNGGQVIRLGAYWWSADAPRLRELAATMDPNAALIFAFPGKAARSAIRAVRVSELATRCEHWCAEVARQRALFMDPDSQLVYTKDPREQV